MNSETEWVLVPREPTPEMLEKGGVWNTEMDTPPEHEVLHRIWRDMLAAAPQPPAEAQAQGGGERKPDGFHYRYRDPYGGEGTIIRTNNGQEVNGSWPIEAVPYYYAAPPSAPDRAADAAQQPPAETQPVYVGVDLEGGWIRATEAQPVDKAIDDALAHGTGVLRLSVEHVPHSEYANTPPSAPVGVDGVKCPWDGGSPCVEPRPIGMVYPMKPAPRASGYLDGSGVEWNAWDAEQMEAYARAAYSDGWEAGYRSALAQQPAACVGCEGKPAPENTPCAVCGQQPAAVDEEAVDWHVAEGQCIASVQIARDGTPIVICYGRDHPTGRYVLAAQQGGRSDD